MAYVKSNNEPLWESNPAEKNTHIHTNEEFNRKTGYIHFCQFEIFAIEAAEI